MAELYHHGIRGQKWGKRNGPPYPLGGGDYSEAEKRAIYKERHRSANSLYNKKHFDEVLRKDSTMLTTLSYDKDRTKNTDMFYAAYNKWDKHQYNALFNKPIPQDIFDKDGNKIGTGQCFKWKIDNALARDIKVASEDSGASEFAKLFKKDRDFYNFVTDKDRMRSYFVDDKYKFKGYREARKVLEKMDDKSYKPTEDDVRTAYRMFNYVIPYDGAGNERNARDVATQRAKFFKLCKNDGYGALLDTNDGIYGAFKAKAPVIMFDMENVVPAEIKRTTASSKRISELALIGRKALHK